MKLIASLLTGIFAISETFYFGNNLHPHSGIEVVCDGMVCMMTVMILLKD